MDNFLGICPSSSAFTFIKVVILLTSIPFKCPRGLCTLRNIVAYPNTVILMPYGFVHSYDWYEIGPFQCNVVYFNDQSLYGFNMGSLKVVNVF